MTETTPVLHESTILSLRLLHRGKVRDVYAADAEHLLIVASDRLSAFDVVFPDPIPGKGAILTEVSNFWFRRTAEVVPNHLVDIPLAAVLPDPRERAQAEGRSVVVREARPLPVEAIVRGYLAGSGWKEYKAGGAICGIPLPPGLEQAAELPAPIFTPSTKAQVGSHDQNISFEQMAALVGRKQAERVRELSLALYREAAVYARGRGIIIADTKFEFGVDAAGELLLIDEALTPDSSRFWPLEDYRTGVSPPSFDKQYIRDYVEALGWNKSPPAPHLAPEVIQRTADKYREARRRLLG